MGDKIKTLSQAIRLGSTFRPQGFHAAPEQKANNVSCALLAAAEALTGELVGCSSEAMWTVGERFDLIGRHLLFQEIFDRNDKHRQTREEIADWLQSQGL